jgi:hypothetical protein
MDIAHTDDGVQLVARCREADGDGGAGSLFVRGICSLGSSLPLLVVVGGHCVFDECECWMRLPKRPTIFGSPNFLQKRLRLLQFLDRPRVMQHGPCEPCQPLWCDVCVRFATAKQDETLLSLPSCATIAASARRDSRNKVATLYYVKTQLSRARSFLRNTTKLDKTSCAPPCPPETHPRPFLVST